MYTGFKKKDGGQRRVRIILADDQPKVRQALRLLLEQEGAMTVMAEAIEAENLLAQVEEARPDLVLLDWGLQEGSEANQFSALRRACPGVAIIVLSAQPEVEEAALAAGADAFVSKADPAELLLAAITGVGRAQNAAVAPAATPRNE